MSEADFILIIIAVPFLICATGAVLLYRRPDWHDPHLVLYAVVGILVGAAVALESDGVPLSAWLIAAVALAELLPIGIGQLAGRVRSAERLAARRGRRRTNG